MSKLSWRAETSYNDTQHLSINDWILLDGQTGSIEGNGNMTISVKLLPSTTVNDSDTGGTITFTCLNCGGSTLRKVFVKRCPLQENNV
jgi:hypothetical protein